MTDIQRLRAIIIDGGPSAFVFTLWFVFCAWTLGLFAASTMTPSLPPVVFVIGGLLGGTVILGVTAWLTPRS